jgi:hypothetical protein
VARVHPVSGAVKLGHIEQLRASFRGSLSGLDSGDWVVIPNLQMVPKI